MTKNKKQPNQWLLLTVLLLILAAIIIYFALNTESWWHAFKLMWQMMKNTFTNPPPFDTWAPLLNVFIPLIALIILLWKIRGFRKCIKDTIGEGTPTRQRWYRFILPILIAMPFVSYVLLSGLTKSVPPVIQFSLIAVSPTLGGLVLTAATNRRLRRITRIELISVAQKLIGATVLLIVFVSLFFTGDLLGGANPSSVEWSVAGFFRWAFLWGSIWTFYIGTCLFLLGISDLVLALRHLRR
jgi:hypothetical protein